MAERELRFSPVAGSIVRNDRGTPVGSVLAVREDHVHRDLKVLFQTDIDGETQRVEAIYRYRDLVRRREPSLLDWKVVDGPVSEPDESVSS